MTMMLAIFAYLLRFLLAAIGLAVVSFLIYYVPASRRPRNFPPGPSGVPILGNLLQLPPERPWVQSVFLSSSFER